MLPINTTQWGSTSLVSTTAPTSGGSLESMVPYANILGSVIGAETIDKTIGQVFANGFNLKCWGSTWTPTRAKEQLPQDLATLRSWAEQVLATPFDHYESAVNDFYIRFYEFKKNERNWLQTTAKDCTKDGLKIYIAGLDKFKGEISSAFIQHAKANGHTLTVIAPKSTTINVPDRNRSMTVMLERFSLKMGSPLQTITNMVNGGKTEASMGIMAVLLLGGFFLFAKKKGTKGLLKF